MSGKSLRLEGQLTGFSSRADGSLGFRGVTPELSTEEKVVMMDLQGLVVEMLIYPKDDVDAEVVQVKHSLECKTPSQRLRDVLFILHKQESGKDDPFEPFYEKRMEQLINFIKNKLK